MFKIETDEEFFNRFNELKMKIDKMSLIFQSEGKELSAIELGEWNMIVNQAKRDFNKLIKEANNRIKSK